MPKLSMRRVVVPLVVIVLLSQFVTMGALYRVVHSNRAFRTYATRQLNNYADQQARLAYSGGKTHVAVVPSDNAVYVPELRLKLPMNLTTEQFVYSIRTSEGDGSSSQLSPMEADVSTAALASYPLPAQPISCASSVRIKLEAKPNPYNPSEHVAASVKLADGRTLQVYSFHDASCASAFKITGTDPDAQAAEFNSATSY